MNILVGYTGGTDLDRTVFALAKQHAKQFDAKLFIATSMSALKKKQPSHFIINPKPSQEIWRSALEAATEEGTSELDKIENDLKEMKASAEREGIPCETHLLIQSLTPGEALVEFAKDNKVDEIFIGIEKTSKVGKLLFGSNAQYIILEAPCPVVSTK